MIVVNHSLLFADLAIKGELGFKNPAVLPPFSRVILDEAHHVERAAGDHFGAQLTRLGALRALGKLARQRNHRRGALGALQRRLLRLAGEAPSASRDTSKRSCSPCACAAASSSSWPSIGS